MTLAVTLVTSGSIVQRLRTVFGRDASQNAFAAEVVAATLSFKCYAAQISSKACHL